MPGRKKNPSMKTQRKSSIKPINIESQTLESYYHKMLLIRRFEEKAGQMYGMGLIGGFCHLYIGQEAVVTGIQNAIKIGDTVITGYRCHAHMLAAGADPKMVMAELTGRCDGTSKGKGGSMHMFFPEGGFYGGHGIVGAQVPIGTGFGFANKYRNNNNVSVTYFGDGAANQGQVFEAFNMAALWNLPVIFVIENNQYAMGTPIARSTAVQELCQRGEAFGIPGLQVDGMDILAVQKEANKAVEKCRAGNGPILLEMMTYRYRGHSMSDPAKYRSREEVSKIRQERDPIQNLKEILEQNGIDTNKLNEIDSQVRTIINEAADYAQNSREPSPSELHIDVFADN